MKNIIHYLISNIVDNPADVNIEERELGDNSLYYAIHVNPADTGKIIGKEGKIIQAIRNTIKIKAIKDNKHVRIEIAENKTENNHLA